MAKSRLLLKVFFGFLLIISTAISSVLLMPAIDAQAHHIRPSPVATEGSIAFSEQPFLPKLKETYRRWEGSSVGQVVGPSPEITLLNFYAVMSLLDHRIQELAADYENNPGLFPTPQEIALENNIQYIFELAVRSLDTSIFPPSIRDDLSYETALKLKNILDHALNTSDQKITIPAKADVYTSAAVAVGAPIFWRLPHSSIVLTNQITNSEGQKEIASDFYFSRNTVRSVSNIYEEIHDLKFDYNFYSSPNLYRDFAKSPGFIVPPRWYASIPKQARGFLEWPVLGQTLLQITSLFFILITYIGFALFAFSLFFQSRSKQVEEEGQDAAELSCYTEWGRESWMRCVVMLPLILLTIFTTSFIDYSLNITGALLITAVFILTISLYGFIFIFSLYFMNAIAQSTVYWLLRLRPYDSNRKFKALRFKNLIIPVSRIATLLIAIVLAYLLLTSLGVPPKFVFAFSAVPGLAIGLGASRLVSNLFAGLYIQTDRPIRIGEFCKIGDNVGFVTRIGLRSLELEKPDCKITIPNTIADDKTITNYSRGRSHDPVGQVQGMELILPLGKNLCPEQSQDIELQITDYLTQNDYLLDPVVFVRRSDHDKTQEELVVCGSVAPYGWHAYLKIRQTIASRFEEIVDQVERGLIKVQIALETPAAKLSKLPDFVYALVEEDHRLLFKSCRLHEIKEYSYEFEIRIASKTNRYHEFLNAINLFYMNLVSALDKESITIPYPVRVSLNNNRNDLSQS